jgi:Holliday junction DNA helicase RuvA
MMEGQIKAKFPDRVLLQPTGLGIVYEIKISEKTFNELPEPGKQAHFHLYYRVCENSQTLLGFLNADEKNLLEEMMKVNGVGPLTALAVTGIGSPENVRQAIRMGNVAYLARGKRVGDKVAQKICLHFQGKL